MAEAPPKKPPVERRSGMFRDLTPNELAARNAGMTPTQRAACAFAVTQIAASGKPKAEVVASVKQAIANIEALKPAPLSGPTKGGAEPVLKMPPAAKKAIALKALASAPKSKRKQKK